MLAMSDITIDPELESLLPPLSEDELQGLIVSVSKDGFTDPLIVWLGHNILVDGHNRMRIWRDSGANEDEAPQIVEKAFADRDSVKEWMLRRQLARRNLTDAMRVMVALRLKPMLEAKAKGKQKAGGAEKVSQNSDEPIRVDEEIAESAGVSRDTVRKVESVLQSASAPIKDAMLKGDISVSAASEVAEMPVERQEELAAQGPKAIKEAAVEHRKEKERAHVSNNSGNNEWYTPQEFVDAARAVLGAIDLDPASCEVANKLIRAKKFWTATDNGLSRKWSGRVWLNPPYGQPEIADFAKKVIEEVEAERVTQAIVLVNNATETEWGQLLLDNANAICLKRGRIKFLNSDGVPANTPLQGQMFLYFGDNTTEFVNEFNRFGVCLR